MSLRQCIARIQQLIAPEIADVSSGVALLRLLRSDAAEDINQLQHAALILESARHIQTQRPETTSLDWFWHPYQTGGIDEPDLQGLYFLGFTTPLTGIIYNLTIDSEKIARHAAKNNLIPA